MSHTELQELTNAAVKMAAEAIPVGRHDECIVGVAALLLQFGLTDNTVRNALLNKD